MYTADIAAGRLQILLVRRIEQGCILVQNIDVLLLKHLAILAQNLIAVSVILAILGDLVNKEQGQALDAHVVQLFFFFKMRQNRFTNLNAAHILFGNIAHHIAGLDNLTVGKGHGAAQRVNFRNRIALVLLHFLRNIVEIIADTKNTGFTIDGFVVGNFQFNFSHRRLFAGKYDLLQIQITVRSAEVLDLKALDLNFLDQPFVEGIQRIQHIHQIVPFDVGGGIVEREQRVEIFQRLLRYIAAHLLRLVQNDDRAVCLNNINRAAGTELIPFGIDNTGFLALAILFQRGGKRLRVDNHHIDAGVGRKVVELVQVGAVINEEPCFLSVILHKMVGGDLKGFLHALTDCNRGNDHNKLAPAVLLVQLEHGFDVDIGFAGAGFHLNVQAATPHVMYQLRGQFNIVLALQSVDVLQKLIIGQRNSLIFITGIAQQILQFHLFRIICEWQKTQLLRFLVQGSGVADIRHAAAVRLPRKDIDHGVHRIGLILLYFEIELHGFTLSIY